MGTSVIPPGRLSPGRPHLRRPDQAGWAASDRPAAANQWRALIPLAETWTPPAFPLTGEEVIAAGVPKGPLVGQVMKEVEDWWVDQDFIDDKLAAVERLKAVAQGMAY